MYRYLYKYLFVAITLLTVTGCGDSTSVEKSIESKEEVAVYINDLKASDDELKMSKLIENTITYEEVGIGIEDIKESNEEHKIKKSTSNSFYKSILTRVVEDAEHSNINSWRVYDKTPQGASISNVYDSDKQSRVIEVNGSGTKNGFTISLGNDLRNRTIKWSMKYSEEYVVYVRINTEKGHRYLYYSPTNRNYGKEKSPYAHYIHHGLGSSSKNGTWQTFSRDLEADLKEFEPDNSLISTEAFLIRGSGSVDDIMMGERVTSVNDKVAPVITLNGEGNITLTVGDRYVEQNATAVDDVDGDVSIRISGTVDTSTVGTYVITYSAKDSSDNSASKTRTVNVIKKVVEAPLNLESNSTELNLGKSVLLTVKSGETQDVSSDVEWIVTPSDNAKMSNNILTAKKEGNVTVEAKYQGQTSNKLLFDVHWVIKGYILPPEPDEAKNSATLGGVDSNNNGVRDDVERKIYKKYPKKLHSTLLMDNAKIYQRTLVESTSNAVIIQKDVTRVIDCKIYLGRLNEDIKSRNWRNNRKSVKNLTFNNADRVEKYLKYNLALSGGSYGSSMSDVNREACSSEVVNALEEAGL